MSRDNTGKPRLLAGFLITQHYYVKGWSLKEGEPCQGGNRSCYNGGVITLIQVFIFVLGAIVGSFLNVVILRFNTGQTIVGGRSRCLACGATLRWFELVPLLSFVWQKGRCRRCGSGLSWQYPAVELASALLFVAVWNLGAPPAVAILYWAIVALLIVIAVYDLRHKIIPDGFVYGFIGLSLLAALLRNDILFAFLAATVFFAVFALIWFLSKGRLMGFGDAKLALGIGLLLGLRAGFSALVIAFWLGALAGLALITYSRLFSGRQYFTMKSELPFAPLMALGAVLNLFFGFDVLSLFQFW